MEKENEEKSTRTKKERQIIVLYNSGGGKMHQVILTAEENQLIEWYIVDMLRKKRKELTADKKVICEIEPIIDEYYNYE